MAPCAALAQTPPEPAPTIIVDASTTVAESDSGNDLNTLKNIFQGANAPQDSVQDGVIAPLDQTFRHIGMRRLRILLSDVYCDLDAEKNFGWVSRDGNGIGPFVIDKCEPLDGQIRSAIAYGLTPHVALASSVPESFAQLGPAETWDPPTTMARYKEYAEKLVRHVLKTSFASGATGVVFEISNELDIADAVPVNFNPLDTTRSHWTLKPLGPFSRFLWWIDPATYDITQFPPSPVDPNVWPETYNSYPYIGDVRRVSRGISPIQRIFGEKIELIKNEAAFQLLYPGKTIQYAGPAFSGWSFGLLNHRAQEIPTLEEKFLDDMSQGPFETSLDYFSFHYYGDFQRGVSKLDSAAAKQSSTFAFQTNRIRNKLTALGRTGTKLFLSEWGPTAVEDTSNPDNAWEADINYSHKGAAWSAAFLTEAVASKVVMGSYLIVSDFAGLPPVDSQNNPRLNYEGLPGQASLTHKSVRNGVATYYPKPPTNVFRMFNLMSGTRRAVTLAPAASSNIRAFAASDEYSAGVVVFNYDNKIFDNGFTEPPPEPFKLELNHLPFYDGEVTVKRYLVDRTHSNLAAFLGDPDHPSPYLQLVEEFNAPVQNGRLVLPASSLGLGVMFYNVLSY